MINYRMLGDVKVIEINFNGNYDQIDVNDIFYLSTGEDLNREVPAYLLHIKNKEKKLVYYFVFDNAMERCEYLIKFMDIREENLTKRICIKEQ